MLMRDGNLPRSDMETYPSDESSPLTNEKELKDNETDAAASLCEYLQRGIEYYSGKKPKLYVSGARQMDLLLRLGPVDWEKPAVVTPEEVHFVIHYIFTKLTVPGPGGFCWADQVRSPDALRRHWTKLVLAIRERSIEAKQRPFRRRQSRNGRHHPEVDGKRSVKWKSTLGTSHGMRSCLVPRSRPSHHSTRRSLRTRIERDKATVVLRALSASGLRKPYDFDMAEAVKVWATQIGRFSLDELTEAVRDWIAQPDQDFPRSGTWSHSATGSVGSGPRSSGSPKLGIGAGARNAATTAGSTSTGTSLRLTSPKGWRSTEYPMGQWSKLGLTSCAPAPFAPT